MPGHCWFKRNREDLGKFKSMVYEEIQVTILMFLGIYVAQSTIISKKGIYVAQSILFLRKEGGNENSWWENVNKAEREGKKAGGRTEEGSLTWLSKLLNNGIMVI